MLAHNSSVRCVPHSGLADQIALNSRSSILTGKIAVQVINFVRGLTGKIDGLSREIAQRLIALIDDADCSRFSLDDVR